MEADQNKVQAFRGWISEAQGKMVISGGSFILYSITMY